MFSRVSIYRDLLGRREAKRSEAKRSEGEAKAKRRQTKNNKATRRIDMSTLRSSSQEKCCPHTTVSPIYTYIYIYI